METTLLLSKVIGPVLVLRGISLLIDRPHFLALLKGLEAETKTVSFSLFPIALLMACITLTQFHHDTSSLAALFIHGIAWGGIIKASLLILFPGLMVKKAQTLGMHGFLHVVTAVCLAMGAYFCWFGYLA